MKILIIEDDFTSQKVLSHHLSRYGKCDIAFSGREGISYFKRSIDDKNRYDLICLDIMMPELDGHATLIEMRSIEKEAGIHRLERSKVVMVTALSDSKNFIDSFKENCDGYLVKPVENEKLQEILQYLKLIK